MSASASESKVSNTVNNRQIASRSCTRAVRCHQHDSATLPGDSRVRSSEFAEPGAIEVFGSRQVQDDLFPTLVEQAVDLVLQSSAVVAGLQLAADVDQGDCAGAPFLKVHDSLPPQPMFPVPDGRELPEVYVFLPCVTSESGSPALRG